MIRIYDQKLLDHGTKRKLNSERVSGVISSASWLWTADRSTCSHWRSPIILTRQGNRTVLFPCVLCLVGSCQCRLFCLAVLWNWRHCPGCLCFTNKWLIDWLIEAYRSELSDSTNRTDFELSILLSERRVKMSK